ncbi:amino acid transporter avt1h [Quercus suber]|uniref:Amino acid transporter avt1h n=1 Tax=Quercus suber TaxID=58331 RepID=A0AAW0KD25_QUESU
MWKKISKSMRNLLCLQPNRLLHRNEVLNETLHGASLDVQWVSSHVCLEESNPCMCNHSIKNLESVEINGIAIEHSVGANGSFAHAVINMIGMLIGLGQLSTPYALERGGWVSAFLLIGLGIICAYTSHLLGKLPCTSIFGGVKPNHKIPVLQLHNIPAISGLYIFSYAGHIVFPNLYKEMKDPSRFTKVSIVSFTIVTALYTVLAFLGAKLFGPEVNSQITLSMPPHLLVTKIALWATVLTPMTKYALEIAPFAIQLEHNLPVSMSSKLKMIIRGCVGSFLLLLILALALSVPYFEYVLSLTGSLVSIAICVIFPCAFHTKICWGQISKPLIILNLTLIAFGSLLGVFGTVSSSKALVQSLRRRAHHSA